MLNTVYHVFTENAIPLFAFPGGILTFACGLAQRSALGKAGLCPSLLSTWAFIHHRPQFESITGFDLRSRAGRGCGSLAPLGPNSLPHPFESLWIKVKQKAPGWGPFALASPAGFEPTAFRLGAQIMVVLMDYLFHDFRSEKHDYYRHVGLFCIPRMILFHDLLRNRSKKVVVNL